MFHEQATGEPVTDTEFMRVAGTAALVAAVAGLLYSIAFVVLRNSLIAALMLTAGGLLSAIALVAVYRLVDRAGSGLALVGLGFGVLGAAGAAIHGAYDLANAIHAPAASTDLPNAVDPRGFLTFGMSGLGILTLSALALRARTLPSTWAWLGLAVGVLLIVVYLARLIILDATSPLVLAPAALVGFIANPLWYGWLGRELLRLAVRS